MIEELVDKPCFGVVPYMQVDLEEEDSLIVKNDYKEWQNHYVYGYETRRA